MERASPSRHLWLWMICWAASIGFGQVVVPQTPEALALIFTDNTRHVDDRLAAIEAFVGLGRAATDHVSSLSETLLESTSSDVRSAAAQGLGALGPVDCSVVPALTWSLRNPHPTVRLRSAEAFHWPELAAVGEEAVGNLARMVWRDPRKENREAARLALARIGNEASIVIRLLRRGLRTPDIADKRPYIELARAIQTRRHRVVDLLAELAVNGRGVNRFAAIDALGVLGAGNPRAAQALRTGLQGASSVTVIACLNALGHWGAAGASFLPDLQALSVAEDPAIREAAERALAAVSAMVVSQGSN